jgi:glutaconate CoA-transferase subunit A
MKDRTSSSVRNISKLSADEIRKVADEPFEWWGASPERAREVASGKSKALVDKRATLKEAVGKYIHDGVNIAIGGFVNSRIPVAITHEIIRKGAKDLTISFHSNSMCAELLAGAMLLYPDHISIKRAEFAWWGYEAIGLAPLLRCLASRGMVRFDDYSNYGMAARFKAAAMGLEFLPVRDHGGSDMEQVNRGLMCKSPFTGKNIYLVPACYPDIGLIHVTAADMYGNCRIFGPLGTCPEIAMASTHNIITAEKIIPDENIRTYPNLTEIPYITVDAVVEQPYGAYPGLSYGFYWYDMEHKEMFRNASEEYRRTGGADALKAYYENYIFNSETFDDFLGKTPNNVFKKINELDGGQPIIL